MEGQVVSHYEVLNRIGVGGMGVVYRARDTRLNRTVALKFVTAEMSHDPAEKLRLLREARAVSALDHPNIAAIHSIEELDDGRVMLVMAYYDGPTLQDRIARGPLAIDEAVQIAAQMADGLAEAHRAGIVHCDIKPANTLLGPRQVVKIVDFGISRVVAGRATTTAAAAAVGTLPYMAPEQLNGGDIDARTDVWALGVVLYEMLAGRRPFDGDATAIVAGILHRDPLPLSLVRPDIPSSLEAVITTALARIPAERLSSADALATALRSRSAPTAPRPRAVTRLIVLPFRLLRADPEIDFLSFSLSDAITASLIGLDSVQVRSSAVAARFGTGAVDLPTIAGEAGVDVILRGTIARAGARVRVRAELVDAAGSGTSLWSQTSEEEMRDLFALQDDLTTRIVDGLTVPLTAREQQRLGRDVPASAAAFEAFLRANRFAQDVAHWQTARSLYEQCLHSDPSYAPAWARLGRICWLEGKYTAAESAENLSRAKAAFDTALRLNPGLAMTHHLLTPLEVDIGLASEAVVRLVTLARERPGDAELFAGLVHACRFCGLLDASIRADACARRIDARIHTSVVQTRFHQGDYAHVAMLDPQEFPIVVGCALIAEGRMDEAATKLRPLESSAHRLRDFVIGLRAFSEGRREASFNAIKGILDAGFRAPEELYHLSRLLAQLGATDSALEAFRRAVDGGFYPLETISRDPWLDPIRHQPAFARAVGIAQRRHQEAANAFAAAGGALLLGVGE